MNIFENPLIGALYAWNIRRITDDEEFVGRVLHIEDGDRILVAGCGPGIYAGYLAKNHPKVEVTGVDMSEFLIKRAAKSFHGLKNLKLISDDVNNLEAAGVYSSIIAPRLFMWTSSEENRIKLADNLYHLLNPEYGELLVSEPTSFSSRFRGHVFGEDDMLAFFLQYGSARITQTQKMRYVICTK
jgi:trans-aconitate methyltransferase